MVQSQFSLSWDSYKTNVCTGFSSLQQNGELVDMTLAADGHFVKVHQVLIALSSPYLKQLILSAPCQHPVIFLNNVSHSTLTLLLEYIYTGEVVVPSVNLTSFIEAAKALHIKGLETVVESNTTDNKVQLNLEENNIGTPSFIRKASNVSEQISLPSSATKIIVKRKDECDSVGPMKKSFNVSGQDDFSDYIPMDDTMHDSDDHFNDSIQDMEKGAISKDKLSSSNLQFTVSIRGSLQVILNRYIYNSHSTQSTGIRRWRCIDYRDKKCKAFLVTKDNVVMKRANPHNHTFHDKKILGKIERNAVYSALDDAKDYMEKEKAKDTVPMESEFVGLQYNTE